jgi:hypothetical protein
MADYVAASGLGDQAWTQSSVTAKNFAVRSPALAVIGPQLAV